MLTVIILANVLLFICIGIMYSIWLNKQQNINPTPGKTEFMLVLKRAVLIFLFAMVVGAFLVTIMSVINSGFPHRSATENILEIMAAWFVFTFYGSILSIIPAMIVLVPCLYFILNSRFNGKTKLKLNLGLGILISAAVIIVNIFTEVSIDMFETELVFTIPGIFACVFIPKWFGDYR